jgi:hypothetical protein
LFVFFFVSGPLLYLEISLKTWTLCIPVATIGFKYNKTGNKHQQIMMWAKHYDIWIQSNVASETKPEIWDAIKSIIQAKRINVVCLLMICEGGVSDVNITLHYYTLKSMILCLFNVCYLIIDNLCVKIKRQIYKSSLKTNFYNSN